MISDGEQYGFAILNSTCASLVTSEAVKVHQIVVLKEYVVQMLGDKKCVCTTMHTP